MKKSGFLFILAAMALVSNASAQESQFGRSGRMGFNGRSGTNGRDGQDVEMHVTGQDLVLQLGGQSGTPGEDATDGEDASSCHQDTYASYSVVGADGGQGGIGGVGGNGGRGGDLTLYTDNLENLRRVFVTATAGRGAPGGRGGFGGRACHCRVYQWQKELCDQNGNCSVVTYTCRDGQDGFYGMNGPTGVDGTMGKLTVIPQLSELPENHSQERVSLHSITQTPVRLIRKRWAEKQGAIALLAPGSRIQNIYREYLGAEEKEVSFIWSAPRAVTEFQNGSVDVAFAAENSSSVSTRFPNTLWVLAEKSESNERQVQVRITKAVHAFEPGQLALSIDQENNLNAVITDLARVSDDLVTTVHLELEVKARVFYRTLYDRQVSASELQYANQAWTIPLRGLSGVDVSELRSGKQIRVTVNVTRQLGSNRDSYRFQKTAMLR